MTAVSYIKSRPGKQAGCNDRDVYTGVLLWHGTSDLRMDTRQIQGEI